MSSHAIVPILSLIIFWVCVSRTLCSYSFHLHWMGVIGGQDQWLLHCSNPIWPQPFENYGGAQKRTMQHAIARRPDDRHCCLVDVQCSKGERAKLTWFYRDHILYCWRNIWKKRNSESSNRSKKSAYQVALLAKRRLTPSSWQLGLICCRCGPSSFVWRPLSLFSSGLRCLAQGPGAFL
jgi:hypothetical protein